MNQPCFIELLGGLQVLQGDRTISRFRTHKTAALLAYLACFIKRSHPREELIELLWSDSDPTDSRASLRMALSSLRRQLEPPGTSYHSVLVADRLNVRLNAQAVSTDIARFEASLQAATRLENLPERVQALSQTIDLYRGPLLPGFYEDWALQERERLEQVYLAALRQLTSALEQQGAFGQAVEYALRQIRTDPLLEEARYDLIRLYLANGQGEAARGQYEEWERVSQEELGVPPSPTVQALAIHLPVLPRLAPLPSKRVRSVPPAPASLPLPTPLPSLSLSSRLPLHLTPFFGREEERAGLRTLLDRDSLAASPAPPTRLLTLTGPGGSGKTRLAVEIAREMSATYEGRVWFVPLADITEASLLLDTLLTALGLSRSAQMEPLEQIAQALPSQPTLLLLDNFEQLAETGAPIVWMLLERIPALTCLLTSRQRLEIAGEREFPVQPLPVPGVRDDLSHASQLSPQELMQFASIQLFVERAQAARPDFQITPENAPTIAALCLRLEGLPLALELAAAWSATLTPSQMLARLEDRFAFLTSRRKGAISRHRTLRDAIEWSYRLLAPELQHLFARLSVFRGGFQQEAAEAVAGSAPENASENTTLHLLAELCSRSLLVAEEVGEEMRFRLLETLREYAWERLTESGEAKAIGIRHRDYFLAMAAAAQSSTASQAPLLLLEAELDNLRAALRFSLHSPQPASRAVGLRLALALCPFWEGRGYLSEGQRWLETLLAENTEAEGSLRGQAFNAAGHLAWQLGRYASARLLFEAGLALFRQSNEPQGIANALHGLGIITEEQGDYEAARAFLEESLAIKRELGDKRGLASSLNTLANAVSGQGDLLAARTLYEESLMLMRQLEDKRGISNSLNNLAIVAYHLEDFTQARLLLEESLTIRRQRGDPRGISICLHNLGELAWREGEIALACAFTEEALAIRRQLGDKKGIASSLAQLAHLAASQENTASARSLYTQSLAIRQEIWDKPGIAECLEKLAEVAVMQEERERAAWLFGAAESLRQTMDSPLPPVEQALHDRALLRLQAHLKAEVLSQAWQAGGAMPLEQAIQHLLDEKPLARAQGKK